MKVKITKDRLESCVDFRYFKLNNLSNLTTTCNTNYDESFVAQFFAKSFINLFHKVSKNINKEKIEIHI